MGCEAWRCGERGHSRAPPRLCADPESLARRSRCSIEPPALADGERSLREGTRMTAIAQEMIELADLIEKSQGLICMARGGRIVHLGARRTSLVVMALREAANGLSHPRPERPVSENAGDG